MSPAELRRQARADWEVRKFGAGEQEAAADHDALFWDRIPADQRAEVVWELSTELFALANPESRESGLPRSSYRLQRR